MQEQLRDIMMVTAGMYGKRYSKRQKSRFAGYIQNTAKKAGLPFRIPAAGNGSEVQNLVLGDLKKAKLVLACSYDTPSKAFLPGTVWYPFDASKTLEGEKKEMIFRIAAAVLFLAAYAALMVLTGFGSLGWKAVPFHILAAFISFKLILGIANRYNFRRSSATLAVVLNILRENTSKDIAYVFLDRTANGYEGFDALREEDKNLIDKKITLFLGSLGKGSHLCLASGGIREITKSKMLYYPEEGIGGLTMEKIWVTEESKERCPMFCFEKGLYLIQADSMEDGEPVLTGTRRKTDCEADFSQLVQIYELIQKNIDRFIR